MTIDVTPTGVYIGYQLPLPSVAVGVMSLQNMSLGAALTLFLDGGDVRGELDHLVGASVAVQNWIVAGLDHHPLAALAVAHELVRHELTGVQLAPQLGIGRRLRLGRIDEDPVVTSDDFGHFGDGNPCVFNKKIENLPVYGIDFTDNLLELGH